MRNLMTEFLAWPGRRVTILPVSLCAVSSATRIAKSCVSFRRNSWSHVHGTEAELFKMEMPHLLHWESKICSGVVFPSFFFGRKSTCVKHARLQPFDSKF
jgi:hypothetical protein